MDQGVVFILIVIGIAYAFDFINGFHDAANAIATIVTTGVLTPRQAVIWAAFFSLIAFVFFNLMVAHTIGHDLIDQSVVDTKLIFAALIGAILWNLLTWYFGLPSSSSHALIGGLAGAAIARGGFATLKLTGFVKVAIGIVISPILGLAISLSFTFVLTHLLRHHDEHTLDHVFKGFQLASSALLSLTHGSNDAQKTMGIIAVLLFSTHWVNGPFYVPFWVVISCQAVISLGTLFGGWRIVNTMGNKITKLNTLRGCTAETSAAATILAATIFGVPVSTTQTVTGAIAGVGLVNGLSGTHWPTIRLILLSWLFTIPAAGVVAGTIISIIH
ncbi:MAG: inorganic phosphate transporter [Legionellales bacterium]|nr:inorganic phosphate transporter [Legionellales bacterium]